MQELYNKYASRYKQEIGEPEAEFSKSFIQSSNLQCAVNEAIQIAENVSGVWLLADYSGKQKLQYLLFTERITYTKENEAGQTERVNSLFGCIEPGTRDVAENKKRF